LRKVGCGGRGVQRDPDPANFQEATIVIP
jgi:hypothetical protein